MISSQRDTLKRVFTIQGEQAEAQHLAQKVKDNIGIPADVPALGDVVEI
jgi:hypothetical protein